MKKLLSLVAGVIMSVIVFAQDTIPTSLNKNTPGSNRLDTMPTTDKWNKDTSSLSRRDKWPDTSMNRKTGDTSMRRNTLPDTLTGIPNAANTTTNKPDTSMTSVDNKWKDSAASTTRAMNNAKDVNRSDSSMSSSVEKKAQSTAKSTMTENANTSSDSTSSTSNKVEDRVIMIDDKMMVIKNGDSTLLEDKITLKSGAVVMKDGNVKYKNGSTATLKNGQYINLNPAEKKAGKSTSKKKTTE